MIECLTYSCVLSIRLSIWIILKFFWKISIATMLDEVNIVSIFVELYQTSRFCHLCKSISLDLEINVWHSPLYLKLLLIECRWYLTS